MDDQNKNLILATVLSFLVIVGWFIALAVSSVIFSAVHYLPPLGDAFTLSSFVFRVLCGVAFALVFQLRGFALAAWTHTLYDVFYFILRHPS